jgi:DNA-binding MarR family transcriptional regulator
MTARARPKAGNGLVSAPAVTRPGATEPMLLYLIKQLELAVRSHLDEMLRPAGLTALQYTALTVLERHADLSSAQLARNSFVTAQSMADMITALEGRGLIERHRDDADRRRLVVALTAAGQELLDHHRDQGGHRQPAPRPAHLPCQPGGAPAPLTRRTRPHRCRRRGRIPRSGRCRRMITTPC